MLKVENLTKHFGGLTAVDSVGFEIERGHTVAIMGPNGAGKTTLFNIISGFERPTHGRVHLAGVDVTSVAPHELVRLGLTRSFQIPQPFRDMSVLDNVMVAAVQARRNGRDPAEQAFSALERVGLTHRAGVKAELIPVGEAKRLELARVLATSPDVVMLDEPFGGLTAGEIEPLVDVVRSLSAEGRTVVIVEHRLRQVLPLVDRVLVMDRGKLIADGTAREVVADPEVLRAYFGEKGASNLGIA